MVNYDTRSDFALAKIKRIPISCGPVVTRIVTRQMSQVQGTLFIKKLHVILCINIKSIVKQNGIERKR